MSSVMLQVCVQPHLQLPDLVSKAFIPLVSAQPTLLQIFCFWCGWCLLLCYLERETSLLACMETKVQDLKEP